MIGKQPPPITDVSWGFGGGSAAFALTTANDGRAAVLAHALHGSCAHNPPIAATLANRDDGATEPAARHRSAVIGRVSCPWPHPRAHTHANSWSANGCYDACDVKRDVCSKAKRIWWGDGDSLR